MDLQKEAARLAFEAAGIDCAQNSSVVSGSQPQNKGDEANKPKKNKKKVKKGQPEPEPEPEKLPDRAGRQTKWSKPVPKPS